MTYNVTLEDAGKAEVYLAETDTKFGEAVANVDRTKHLMKTVLAGQKAISKEKSNVAKEDWAIQTPAYQEASEAHFAAIMKLKVLQAKRDRAHVKLDLFRTLEASRRRT